MQQYRLWLLHQDALPDPKHQDRTLGHSGLAVDLPPPAASRETVTDPYLDLFRISICTTLTRTG